MIIYDSINNQFKLYDYIAKLNVNLLLYLENNNININYYCFYSRIINNKHYIITSKTIKRKNNGYRLITIQNVEQDSCIFDRVGNLNIIFENIRIKITSLVDNISDISNKLWIVVKTCDRQLTNSNKIDFGNQYDKNILESNITVITNVMRLDILNNFDKLEKLVIDSYYNQIIGVNVLPNSLRTLIFSDEHSPEFNFQIRMSNFYYGSNYNQIIGVNVLPNLLQTLTFGHYFNQTIGINVLPNSLLALTFGHCYNLTIGINVLPNSLNSLTFGSDYDQTIGIKVLPNSLQTLTFGTDYNQTIGIKVLPNSLQTLTFGSHYNQTIGIKVLPNSLQTLTFGICYNQIIGINVLPNSLQSLTFGVNYNQVIDDNILPNSLQTLTFCFLYDKTIDDNVLPNSLQKIYFNFCDNSKSGWSKKHIIPKAFRYIIKNINVKN
jgi:hypothetical protein